MKKNKLTPSIFNLSGRYDVLKSETATKMEQSKKELSEIINKREATGEESTKVSRNFVLLILLFGVLALAALLLAFM
ncbi:hypothetical protein EQG49_13475 [Periweissella cryptocerci]|uniref:Uncharacterized protein n=1 Tax=Periweissella cryptocerci TaxID=2506420 RepID=A0A4P6YX23_9LACO|nr:hypothetical protein [Periweissella cryptocerci]QBO37408.1 hypothetical protein EQG49_13475 [Periweissella cryptocerci]